MTIPRMSACDPKVLLTPISSKNRVGDFLRYDPVYDQIKEARREDNEKLSQGIWQTPLKKADWPYVENLCHELLISKTKDLQIAAWLVEAWIALDGLDGLSKGLAFLIKLVDLYWPELYPQMQDDDLEYRLRILEWMDESFVQRLILMPLTHCDLNEKGCTLADWLFAKRLESLSKRTPEGAKLLSKAEAAHDVTLDQFNKELALTNTDFIKKTHAKIIKALNDFQVFKSTIEKLTQGQSPSYKNLAARLQDVERLFRSTLMEREKKKKKSSDIPQKQEVLSRKESDSENSIGSIHQMRRASYQKLAEIADSLEKLEPHGPVHHFLRRIVTWENKSLTDILQEFDASSQDLTVLVKLMKSPGQ